MDFLVWTVLAYFLALIFPGKNLDKASFYFDEFCDKPQMTALPFRSGRRLEGVDEAKTELKDVH